MDLNYVHETITKILEYFYHNFVQSKEASTSQEV